jgi:hypothetical protein
VVKNTVVATIEQNTQLYQQSPNSIFTNESTILVVGWLDGLLVGWLVAPGWLVGWLVG